MSEKEFEYECRKCKTHTFVCRPFPDLPCPLCGSLLTPAPKPRYWIFQFNPNIYLWFERMKNTAGKKPEQWLASRHGEYMKKGDFVAIWASGKKAGIYALGQLITYATENPLNADDYRYWRKEEAANKFLYCKSVWVEYLKNLSNNPIYELECKKDETLADMTILVRQQATNFQISFNQWQRIVMLAAKRP
jgi:hypothetical protein